MPAGSIPSSIVAGDFNGDGKLDWVVSNAGDNSIDLYLGNGDGTSQLPFIISVSGQSPVAAAVGDLNGDGRLDIVLAEADSNTVGILFGNGDGTFQAEVEVALSEAPLGVSLADVNKDGHLDLLVGIAGTATTNTFFAVLLNDGTGHFGSPIYAPNAEPNSVVEGTGFSVTDLNADGIPDVLVEGIDARGTVAYTYLGKGDGTFAVGQFIWRSQINSVFASDIGVALLTDVNGDSCPDVVLTVTAGDALVFTNDCKGTFPAAPSLRYGMGDGAYGLAVADINGDGFPDLIAGAVPLFLQLAAGTGYEAGDAMSVRFNDGTGHFGPARLYRGEEGMVSVIAADVNGNGRPAILTANQNGNSASIYLNDGFGGFSEPTGGYEGFEEGIATSPTNAPDARHVVADIDGDGKPDLALFEYPEQGSFNNMSTLNVLLNQGQGQFSLPIRTPAIASGFFVADYIFADFRSVGRPDLLALVFTQASPTSTQLIYMKNLGNGQFSAPTTIPIQLVNGNPEGALGVGDFNHDGKPDFCLAVPSGVGSSPEQLTIFLGNGDGTFNQSHQVDYGPTGFAYAPVGTFIGDANSDGKPDVFVYLATNISGPGAPPSGLFEFLGNGDGTFQPPHEVLQGLVLMTMADVNHDGRLDVVEMKDSTLNGTSGPIVNVYLGQTDGSFAQPVSYAPYSGLFVTPLGALDNLVDNFLGPYLGDFNGDGNLDIAIFQPTSLTTTTPAFVQFLVGNGDGTFTPTYDVFKLGIPEIPDLAASNLLGDGRSALVQTPGFTASYQVLPSSNAPAFQIEPAETPVIGSADAVELTLNVPSTSDTVVLLGTSDPGIQIPTSATIPAGSISTSVPFNLSTSVPKNRWFSITATANNETHDVYDFPGRSSVDSFSLQIVPPLTNVQQGGTSQYWSAGVQSVGDASAVFQFGCSGLPPGVSCQFQNDIATITVLGDSFENVLFNVAASFSASPGNYSFTVFATDGVRTLSAPQTLQVTAAPPALSVSPTQLTFAPALVGTTSSGQTITVFNNRSTLLSPLNLTGPSNNSPNGTFHTVSTCGSSLGAGASCTVQVSFAAAQVGAVNDQLTVSADVVASVALSATSSDFSFQPASGGSSSVTVQAGQTAVFNLQLMPTSFQGIISVSCAGAPPQGQCTAPQQVSPGTTATPVQVSVSTTGPTLRSKVGPFRHPVVPATLLVTVISILFIATIMAGLFRLTNNGVSAGDSIVLGLVFAGMLALGSCAGGSGASNASGSGNPGNPGTPAGTYTVTVSGSVGSFSRSIQLTLTVH